MKNRFMVLNNGKGLYICNTDGAVLRSLDSMNETRTTLRDAADLTFDIRYKLINPSPSAFQMLEDMKMTAVEEIGQGWLSIYNPKSDEVIELVDEIIEAMMEAA